MSTPDKIAQTGKLSDRIAKLGLGTPPAGNGSAVPTSPSPESVRTGAVTRVSDKISRFQANAEHRPLLPEGGSFGFAPAKSRSSTGSARERHADDKQRVVSLGGGRAPVPIAAVTPRSVSASSSPRTGTPEPGLAGTDTPPLSRSNSAASGKNSQPSKGPEPVRQAGDADVSHEGGEETPVASPTASPAASVALPDRPDALSLNSLPAEPRTPGAMSVSSMRVETGSIASEGREGSTTDLDLSQSNAPYPSDSPLSSPIVSGLTVPASTAGSISSADGIPPSLAPVMLGGSGDASKGLVQKARALSRSGSTVSFSSMTVEAPTDDVANMSLISTEDGPGTPTAKEPTSDEVSAQVEESAGEARAQTPTNDEPTDVERLERTRDELAQYEGETSDPPVKSPFAPPGHQQEDQQSDRGEPVEPPMLEEPVQELQGRTSADEQVVGPERKASPIPDVKCSDCGQDVPLLDLADHTCAKEEVAPMSTPPPPVPTSTLESAVPAPDRPEPDVPDEPVEDDLLGSAEPASPSATAAAPSGKGPKLDAFVPQTDDLVPEDVLDMYGDEVEEDKEQHDAVPAAKSEAALGEPGLPRSASIDSPLPGKYYTSDDEDHGEPGSATIVRSSSQQ